MKPAAELITAEGQPCRHCSTPVVRREHNPPRKLKRPRAYYFRWWYACPACGVVYLVEAAKTYQATDQPAATKPVATELPRWW